MKQIVFLDAGHSLTDPGTVSIYAKESDLNIKIRDCLTPELQRNGFEVKAVPDNLNLADSITWVNERSKQIEDGLALAVHNNCCGGSGPETYYYGNSESSKKIAWQLLKGYCEEMGIPFEEKRVRSDTTGRWGELGWIRKTEPWATLIECFYIDNKENVEYGKNNILKIAQGIASGACRIYGIPYLKETSQPEIKTKEQLKAEAKRIIDLL